jgi:nucleoid-associated protein YgaU
MSRQAFPIIILVCCLLGSCSSAPAPTWRSKATALVDELERREAPGLFPQEYQNLLETFEHGEAVLYVQEDDAEADSYYLMVLQKGSVLREHVIRLKERQRAEALKRAAELAAHAEEERLAREVTEAVEHQRIQEQLKAAEDSAVVKASPSVRDTLPQLSLYTVRRGETLPQISARFEIYNDSSLWPLIYRANRDQISDPKRLWPGQTLTIPRHFSREEALEAKRYSGKK